MISEADRERERLRYIRDSIALIAQYTGGREEAFRREPIVQDAVVRRLETLADATSKLSDELKARHPQISWRQVYGFRNVAAHAYERLDMDRVWEIVRDYLPDLEAVVNEELRRGDRA